jgi:murein DD-endopeptidase MepM/ murein hydrolase activator NlpD
MQKNDKAYVFLLSHSSKSGIYIRRVAAPKRIVHVGIASVFFCFGMTGISLLASNLRNNSPFIETVSSASILTKISAESHVKTDAIETALQEQQPAEELASGSGGPEDDDQLVNESKQLDGELGEIQKNSDPANLPSIWAHLGKINNEFGFRRNPFGGRSYEFHPGMDIDGERGDLVVAPANGKVIKAGWTGGYGNMVEIDHGNGLTTRYGHLSKIEVTVGDVINRGQLIGYVGSTGRSTGPHLHYELRLGEKPINPRHFLPPEPTDLTAITKK